MTQSVEGLLNECIYLMIHSSGSLYKSPDIVLVHGDKISDSIVFKVDNQNHKGFFNIINKNTNKAIGGMNENKGRITGKINLSDVSSYNTCIITQLSHRKDRLLLQPLKGKSKYDPRKTNFITRKQFKEE